MMELKHFEDYEPGQMEIAGSYTVDKEELIDYAAKWDPQPFHVDEEAAKTSIYGGITASSLYTMAIGSWLIHLQVMACFYFLLSFFRPSRQATSL